MLLLDLLVAVLTRNLFAAIDGFNRFLCKFIDIRNAFPPFSKVPVQYCDTSQAGI